MLQIAYFLAKIGADTAVNEQHFVEILPTDALWTLAGIGGICCDGESATSPRSPWGSTYFGSPTQLSNYLALMGSFSAVSKPNFASKYAFESSRRDLHNALLCTALKSHFSKKNPRILPRFNLRKFSECFLILLNFEKKCKTFGKILTKNEITELCKGVHCVDLGESFQTYSVLQNLASIQPRTSPVKFARPSNAAVVS